MSFFVDQSTAHALPRNAASEVPRSVASRRGFLSAAVAAIAAFAVDPERALWTPGKKLISIPAPTRNGRVFQMGDMIWLSPRGLYVFVGGDQGQLVSIPLMSWAQASRLESVGVICIEP